MRWWKVLGVAGFAGVAATGVLIARDEHRRMAYTPDEIRRRLHDRLAEGSASDAAAEEAERTEDAEQAERFAPLDS